MASPECIITNLKRLVRNLRGPDVPAATELPALAADWATLLEDAPDEALHAAVAAHLRDPDRGRWWPTVADLRARMPLAPAALTGDEEAWELMLRRVAAGEYSQRGALTDRQIGALQAVGGITAIRQAEVGVGLATLRRRWLDALTQEAGARPALPDRGAVIAFPVSPRRLGAS